MAQVFGSVCRKERKPAFFTVLVCFHDKPPVGLTAASAFFTPQQCGEGGEKRQVSVGWGGQSRLL